MWTGVSGLDDHRVNEADLVVEQGEIKDRHYSLVGSLVVDEHVFDDVVWLVDAVPFAVLVGVLHLDGQRTRSPRELCQSLHIVLELVDHGRKVLELLLADLGLQLLLEGLLVARRQPLLHHSQLLLLELQAQSLVLLTQAFHISSVLRGW